MTNTCGPLGEHRPGACMPWVTGLVDSPVGKVVREATSLRVQTEGGEPREPLLFACCLGGRRQCLDVGIDSSRGRGGVGSSAAPIAALEGQLDRTATLGRNQGSSWRIA